jgi:riboflavin-specific deaminase-like protein
MAETPTLPRHAGKVAEKLASRRDGRIGGVRFEHVRDLDELTDEQLAELYAYPPDVPWVRVNFVSTVDGAAQGADSRAGSISSPADQRLFALLRSLCDLILVGAGTARAEKYRPVKPDEVSSELRQRLGLAPIPTIAVVSRSLDVPDDLLSGSMAKTILVTSQEAYRSRLTQMTEDNRVVVAGEGRVDIGSAIDALSERGYHRISCEGGPTLFADLARSERLDELCVTLSPMLVGGDARRITRGPLITSGVRLQLAHVIGAGDDLFLRYVRRTPKES